MLWTGIKIKVTSKDVRFRLLKELTKDFLEIRLYFYPYNDLVTAINLSLLSLDLS